jgi:hypothetical protein
MTRPTQTIGGMEESDYLKYRGKCKEFCENAVNNDPDLTLVRGHYLCPFWGMQTHWWTVRKDGTIFDPTIKQFPSTAGEYIPFDGSIKCEECGEETSEESMVTHGHHVFCSGECLCRCVGIL